MFKSIVKKKIAMYFIDVTIFQTQRDRYAYVCDKYKKYKKDRFFKKSKDENKKKDFYVYSKMCLFKRNDTTL